MLQIWNKIKQLTVFGVTMATGISVHPDTHTPTKAWQKLAVKQTVDQVAPLTLDTPVSEDSLRFVCLSDTHSKMPATLPPGDVLLHAGDLTNIGLTKEIKHFNEVLGSMPYPVKVVIAGNHDLTFDDDMVKNRRDHLQMQFGVSKKAFEEELHALGLDNIKDVLTNCVYLEDAAIDICGIKIYGSPWQPEFCDWGFNLTRGQDCLDKWNWIPDETDILVTHGPPIGVYIYAEKGSTGPQWETRKPIEKIIDNEETINSMQLLVPEKVIAFSNGKSFMRMTAHSFIEGHGDKCFDGQRVGCVELLSTVQKRVKPQYHVFGHIHEAYGITTDGTTTFINASTCTLRYKPDHPPVIFDIPIPAGHSKDELLSISPHKRIRGQ